MRAVIKNLIFCFVVLVPFYGAKAQAKEQLNIALSNPGKPFVLNLVLSQGSIQVTSYSGSGIQIEAAPQPDKGGNQPSQNSNQNKNNNVNDDFNSGKVVPPSKATMTGKYITLIEASNAVTITPVNPKEKLEIVIKVPRSKGRFHLTSTLHTDITVTDVTGELDITSNAGPINLKNISGSAVVSNVAGSITASFASVARNTPMAFSTLAGKIDVSFPSTLKANLRVDSDNGQLFSDFELDFSQSTSKPNVDRTSQGQFHTQTAGKLSCRIGGGGADIRFKNMEGNIYIRKTK